MNTYLPPHTGVEPKSTEQHTYIPLLTTDEKWDPVYGARLLYFGQLYVDVVQQEGFDSPRPT